MSNCFLNFHVNCLYLSFEPNLRRSIYYGLIAYGTTARTSEMQTRRKKYHSRSSAIEPTDPRAHTHFNLNWNRASGFRCPFWRFIPTLNPILWKCIQNRYSRLTEITTFQIRISTFLLWSSCETCAQYHYHGN